MTLLKNDIPPFFYIKEIQGEAGNKMKEHLTHVGAVLILFTTEDTEDIEGIQFMTYGCDPNFDA